MNLTLLKKRAGWAALLYPADHGDHGDLHYLWFVDYVS